MLGQTICHALKMEKIPLAWNIVKQMCNYFISRQLMIIFLTLFISLLLEVRPQGTRYNRRKRWLHAQLTLLEFSVNYTRWVQMKFYEGMYQNLRDGISQLMLMDGLLEVILQGKTLRKRSYELVYGGPQCIATHMHIFVCNIPNFPSANWNIRVLTFIIQLSK